ncbi:skin secretory protein xP2-like isoform X1 [Chamaea fasciata]|uniref:skin secretory protein xP2-like isoform X1 n=1 Tax=Chamaea fasciata TaxID=190680 RepID=UPI00336A625C
MPRGGFPALSLLPSRAGFFWGGVCPHRNARKIRGNLRWYGHLRQVQAAAAAAAPPGRQGALLAARARLRQELQSLEDAIESAQDTARRLEAALGAEQRRRWAELRRGAELRLLGAGLSPERLRRHQGALKAPRKRPGQSRVELSAILASGAEPQVLVSIKALCAAREAELWRPRPPRKSREEPPQAQDWLEQAEAALVWPRPLPGGHAHPEEPHPGLLGGGGGALGGAAPAPVPPVPPEEAPGGAAAAPGPRGSAQAFPLPGFPGSVSGLPEPGPAAAPPGPPKIPQIRPKNPKIPQIHPKNPKIPQIRPKNPKFGPKNPKIPGFGPKIPGFGPKPGPGAAPAAAPQSEGASAPAAAAAAFPQRRRPGPPRGAAPPAGAGRGRGAGGAWLRPSLAVGGGAEEAWPRAGSAGNAGSAPPPARPGPSPAGGAEGGGAAAGGVAVPGGRLAAAAPPGGAAPAPGGGACAGGGASASPAPCLPPGGRGRAPAPAAIGQRLLPAANRSLATPPGACPPMVGPAGSIRPGHAPRARPLLPLAAALETCRPCPAGHAHRERRGGGHTPLRVSGSSDWLGIKRGRKGGVACVCARC